MNHAFRAASLARDQRHDEALVADGDEFLLQHAFVAMRFQEAFERFLNRLSSAAPCRGASGGARRWHCRRRCHQAESCHPALRSSVRNSPMACARRPRRGKRSATAVSSDFASAARSSRANTSKISLRLETGAFDPQLLNSRLGSPADRRNRCGSRHRARRFAGARRSASIRWLRPPPPSLRFEPTRDRMRLRPSANFAAAHCSKHSGLVRPAGIRIPVPRRWISLKSTCIVDGRGTPSQLPPACPR